MTWRRPSAGRCLFESAGSYAAIVKLSRVALLAPVVIITGLLIGGADKSAGDPAWKRLALPWFIVAFFGVVLLNSLVAIPAPARDFTLSAAKGLLLIAVIATAMRSRLDLLMETGLKPAIPVVFATLVSLAASFAAVMLIG